MKEWRQVSRKVSYTPCWAAMSCVPLSKTLELSETSSSKDGFAQMNSEILSWLIILETLGRAKPPGQRQTGWKSRKRPAIVY